MINVRQWLDFIDVIEYKIMLLLMTKMIGLKLRFIKRVMYFVYVCLSVFWRFTVHK